MKTATTPQPPPAIAPPTDVGEFRPFWSVIIPAYRPDENYLRQTLESVLQQDPGPEQMQIEVVDDCSPGMDIVALVKSIAGDRVKVSQTPRNLGLAGCWNACIERARGEWVHILHQDDWVLPGYYARFEGLIKANPGIDAAFTRHLHADTDGHWILLGPVVMRDAGEFREFDHAAATWPPMQCAAAVVNRSTYEQLGGFRADIPYVLDWEMWCRIGASGRWGYVPQPGAVYREHDQSESTRLRKTGKIARDFFDGGQIIRLHFPTDLQIQTESDFRDSFVNYVLHEAVVLYVHGNPKDAGRLLDSFLTVAMRSNRRWGWLWLRLRVWIKPLRLRLTRVSNPAAKSSE